MSNFFFMIFEKSVLGPEESFFHELASGKIIPEGPKTDFEKIMEKVRLFYYG